jgi:hypothetical protein
VAKLAFPADLLIEGGRICAVARNPGQLDGASAEIIEAGPMFGTKPGSMKPQYSVPLGPRPARYAPPCGNLL